MDGKPFVILLHSNPGPERSDHWDLMLQHQQSLITFEIPIGSFQHNQADNQSHESNSGTSLDSSYESKQLQTAAPTLFTAKQLPDHRLAYLSYQGPVSNNRGSVSQVDSGTYFMLPETADLPAALAAESAIIRLVGGHFCGCLKFFSKKSAGPEYHCSWTSM